MPTKLGQNFLNNPDIIEKIIQSADIKSDDFILEIGPGKGILTEKLIEKAKKVIAIEIDKNLINFLEKKFRNTKNLEIIHDNILNIDSDKLFQMPSTNYKLIANIPYYITSKIIRFFLEQKHPPQEIFLMIQKEVAKRIVAPKGKMSLLSASVQYYAKPKILFEVPKENFSPKPKIDSAVIHIKPNLENVATKEETKFFFRIVRSGFSSKRKTLLNNLSNSLHQEKKETLQKLKSLGFSKNTRAQELSVDDWKKLAQKI